jgi:hypothetical protein
MLRANISEQEWAEIRKQAIDRSVTNAEMVADLLRAGLECLPPIKKEEVA